MNRRDFLRLRTAASRTTTLSCADLYQNYVSACVCGTMAGFVESVERRLAGVSQVRLTDASWFARRELHEALEPVLQRFRQRGGVVIKEEG